jgi:hypothetical protein
MPLGPAVQLLMILLLVLLAFSGTVASVTSVPMLASGPGLLEGFVAGLMSLPKFLASPSMEVTLIDTGARLIGYDIGFLPGVLAFAATGAAAASTPKIVRAETCPMTAPRLATKRVSSSMDARDG